VNADASEDAGTGHARRAPSGSTARSETRDQLVQRWRDLRELLIRQLSMLRSNDQDVSEAAIVTSERASLSSTP